MRARQLLLGVGGGLLAAAALALPTALFPNPLFRRMTPVRTSDWVIWVVSAVLLGLIASTYARPRPLTCQNRVAGAGLMSVLAIGCPICNKVVVLLLGFSGALTYFAPIQPIIGAASVVLLALTLRLRLRQFPSDPVG